ncbi:hypothetical protein WMY93_023139 [Mugilogobius chulae]|uniref:Uncharacterized protein n=1 Tax=Mugilogobius chulae TaxID=88201 RepID=A0AAW0N4K0_9GOBI
MQRTLRHLKFHLREAEHELAVTVAAVLGSKRDGKECVRFDPVNDPIHMRRGHNNNNAQALMVRVPRDREAFVGLKNSNLRYKELKPLANRRAEDINIEKRDKFTTLRSDRRFSHKSSQLLRLIDDEA